MQIKHFSIFQNNSSELNWENLRNDSEEKHYFIPYSKKDYLSKVETDDPSLSTKIILQEIERINLKNIFSIGSGIASQEYQLKKFSDCSVVVTDSNSSILRIKRFDIFDDAFIFDASSDTLPVNGNWIMLFHRIDTEFNDNQLTSLFAKCHNSGINNICFVPAELISLRLIIAEIKVFIVSIIKRKPRIFCGYARSFNSFKKIWSPYYKLNKKFKTDKHIFFLDSK